MLNVVIWGNREQYDLFVNQIKFEELKGNICVKGIVTEDDSCSNEMDGYELIDKKSAGRMCMGGKIDCVLVTSVQFHFLTAKEEILSTIPGAKVINARVLNIPLFDFRRYWEVLEGNVSIISNSCWGGLTYNSVYMEFLSPFINLTIEPLAYIRLLGNFREYMGLPLEMVSDRSVQGNPIGRIGDVEIDFVHYRNFAEAKTCWEKRKERINYDNLFIYMAIESEEIAQMFVNLPIDKKYGFCNFYADHESLHYVKHYENSGEVKRAMGERRFSSYMNDQARRKLYDYDDGIGNRGAKTVKIYDVLKLLNGEGIFRNQREDERI